MPDAMEDRKRRALAAEALAGNETFIAAVEAVDAEFKRAIFNTSVSETDKRNDLFAEWHGLKRAVSTLRRWAADADKMRDDEARN